MAKFRKKPVVIEAFRYYIDPMPDWFIDEVSSRDIILRSKYYRQEYTPGCTDIYCEIKTLEGVMRGDYGDYIIKGINGEIYPCKPDIFDKTYELVESDNTCEEVE